MCGVKRATLDSLSKLAHPAHVAVSRILTEERGRVAILHLERRDGPQQLLVQADQVRRAIDRHPHRGTAFDAPGHTQAKRRPIAQDLIHLRDGGVERVA